MSKSDDEKENEKSLWRKSINMMYQSKDLEGLIQLRESPEDLEDDILEILDNCINQLEEQRTL